MRPSGSLQHPTSEIIDRASTPAPSRRSGLARRTLASALGVLIPAAVVSPALAHDNALLIQFSESPNDFDDVWYPDLVAQPGSTVYVRIIHTVSPGYHAIRAAKWNLISESTADTVSSWDVGGDDVIDLTPAKDDPTDGRMLGFDSEVQQQEFFESPGSLRMDRAGDTLDDPSIGITHIFNDINALDAPLWWAVVFKFAIKLSDNPDFRQIPITVLNEEITSFTAYTVPGEPDWEEVLFRHGDPGILTVVPAPGATGVIAIGVVGIARRRRTR
jgi:hypothetical protein